MEIENNNNDARASLDGRVVLVAVMGTSPAVLTETVWALAHPDDGGEPVIPDEIVVITTLGGEAAIHAQLFGESKGWKRLLAALKREKLPIEGKLLFGETRQSIRVLSDKSRMNDLSDVASSEDNAQMADDFLKILREFTEESARTRVYASIAGGRKTMGALMLSCMSLLGRKGDRVLHVLVNPPFDGGVEPVFLFPEKGVRYQSRGGGKALTARDARLTLIDIPFVKMRGWYQDKFKTLPPRYGELVRAAQSAGPEATVRRPMLTFDFAKGRLLVGDDAVDAGLTAPEFMTLAVDVLLQPDDLAKTIGGIYETVSETLPWIGRFLVSNRFDEDKKAPGKTAVTYRKRIGACTRIRSEIRKKLTRLMERTEFIDELVPKRSRNGSWPTARMSADIPKFKKLVGIV